MFLKNAWYVGCTPDEIDGKPLGRRICGEKVAFFRGPENKVAAVEDFCPHRGAALSLGFVQDGNLVCGYHGLAMGADGKAASMPMQRVAGFPANKTFPVVERYGFIWIWPGDPELADESLIPHLEWADNPDWAYGGGMYHLNCDYRLMIDNLMDLTHETYVHPESIGHHAIDKVPVNTVVQGDSIVTSRYMSNIVAPPFFQLQLRYNGMPTDELMDRWQISRFTPPANILIDVGVAFAGKGGFEAAREDKIGTIVVDFMTPETETSHWYFWGMARNWKPDDAEITEIIRQGQGKIFHQDLAVLEAQQKNLSEYPGRHLLMLNIDAGGVQSRRVLERLVKKENLADIETA